MESCLQTGPGDAILHTAHRAKGSACYTYSPEPSGAGGMSASALGYVMVQGITMQTFRYKALLPSLLGVLSALAAIIALAVQLNTGSRSLGVGIGLAALPLSMLRGIVGMFALANIQVDDLGIRRTIFGIPIRSITWLNVGKVKIITSRKNPDKPFKVFSLTSRTSTSVLSDMPIVMSSRVDDPAAFEKAMESYITRFAIPVLQENSVKDETVLVQSQGIDSTPTPRPELENFGALFDAERARRNEAQQKPAEELSDVLTFTYDQYTSTSIFGLIVSLMLMAIGIAAVVSDTVGGMQILLFLMPVAIILTTVVFAYTPISISNTGLSRSFFGWRFSAISWESIRRAYCFEASSLENGASYMVYNLVPKVPPRFSLLRKGRVCILAKMSGRARFGEQLTARLAEHGVALETNVRR